MKVIVINDSDGHTNVYAYNRDNLWRLLKYVDEIGMLEGGEIPEDPTMEQLEALVEETYWINQRSCQCYITELEADFNPPYNPFE